MPSSPDTDIERFLTIISARFPNKVQSPQDRQAALQWHRLVAGRGDGSALAVSRRPPYLMTSLIQWVFTEMGTACLTDRCLRVYRVLAETLLYEQDWSQPHQSALRYLLERVISEYMYVTPPLSQPTGQLRLIIPDECLRYLQSLTQYHFRRRIER